MSTQTINPQSPHIEELTTETVDAQRDGAGDREPPRSRSTVWPRPTYPQTGPLPDPSLARPTGHAVGHAVGEPPAAWFAGRPRGHVVGPALSEPPPAWFARRPRGHVVGHAAGEPPPAWFARRPRGHVVGHAVGEPPAAWFAGRARGHLVERGDDKALPLPKKTTYREAA